MSLCGPKLALILLVGCASPPQPDESVPPAASCRADEDGAGCTSVPTYSADVAPILAAVCTRCHAPGGVAERDDLTTAAGVHRKASTVLTQVQSCMMPPRGERPLTAAERGTLLRWFSCGAPDQ